MTQPSDRGDGRDGVPSVPPEQERFEQERFARHILAERAATLAARHDAGMADATPGRSMLVLDVGGRECCLDLDAVLRVTDPMWSDMPRRADCPASVRGVYGYQGDLYTVFDLAMLMEEGEQDAPGAMILLRSVSSVPLARIALLAGAARGVMDIPATAPSVLPSGFPTALLPDGRHVVVLDPVRLFSSVRYSGE
ncbi:chemotaxis protein CheW [Novacetimonas pomaceti]|uniref:chemotaxis protein CheW n=1 Tax=Novacetimonas pomaceti TaxID=2021998 RepID=UPI001C2D380D|nr:chemotaxis protein CheW [Novacetimonas pomaceti]MBV1832818.1 chemotaxis protein CheW [Novacetimonas pomaceti]